MEHSGFQFTLPVNDINKKEKLQRCHQTKRRPDPPLSTLLVWMYATLINIPQDAFIPTDKRNPPPAPIIIAGHPRYLKKRVKKGVAIKYRWYNTTVFFNEILDNLAYQAASTQANAQFYTCIGRINKQHANALRSSMRPDRGRTDVTTTGE